MRRRPRLRSLCVGLGLCAAVVAAGCHTSSVRCGERRVMSRESPDRKYTAAAFTRRCVGALAGREEPEEIVTHVNLHGGLGEPPPDADGLITSGEVLVVEGARKVNLVWKDAKSLSIECADCAGAKARTRETSWKDVRVSFDLK